MNAVGILGSYITRGVYTVSAPFHPFGGAVDIVVVEQPDGSFKSSPWYVRFGKFQGVLKTKEKEVKIAVNGVEAGFHMYLDHKGEAYFLREVDVGDESGFSSSSGNDADASSQQEHNGRMMLGSESCNYDDVTEKSKDNGKIGMKTNSRRSRILGFVWGRKSIKEDCYEDTPVARVDSLERAEIAANLLEVKWSTNISPQKLRKDDTRRFSSIKTSHGKDEEKLKTDDGDSQATSAVESNMINTSDHQVGDEDDSAGNGSQFVSKNLEVSVEVARGMVSLNTEDQIDETSVGAHEMKSEISKETEKIAANTDDSVIAMGFNEERLSKCDIYNVEGFNKKCLSSETNVLTQGLSISEDKNISNGIHSSIFCGTSGSSAMTMEESKIQTQKTSHIIIEGSGIVSVHTEQLHVTTEVHSEDTVSSAVADDFEIETEKLDVRTDQIPQLNREVKSDSTNSSSSTDLQDENGVDSKFLHSFNSSSDGVLTEEISMLPSAEIDEEQILFSGYDVSNTDVTRNLESDSQHCNEKRFVYRNYEMCSPDNYVMRSITSPITIPQSHPTSSNEVGRLATSLPNMQAGIDSQIAYEIYHPLTYPVDSKFKSSKWMKLWKGVSSSNSGGNEEVQVSQENPKIEESQLSDELIGVLHDPAVGATIDPGQNWKLWPFSFKRSTSRKETRSAGDKDANLDVVIASDRSIGMSGDVSMFKLKTKKVVVRSISPTSEQLASLNLKEGGNIVTFTFSTVMLGKQQVDARIYLWKWNTRIVISDVDGTITKSDVLGQFMPFVGMDWSQSGVVPLFSAIKENGYQLLFLSARAISQAYHTRQFLFNLKQDGKALPEGPVVISPDGLFPSLYREVIRRAPHEFKIACLERIRELFPQDCNPFYAGFGNRDTDEVSYLKVGIPKGKIFIINPKGEVAVNRRVDTKSYTSLRTLVNGMFPPTASSEQEDFNSWNYWKLPPLMADI